MKGVDIMKRKFIALLCAAVFSCALLTGCAGKEDQGQTSAEAEETEEAEAESSAAEAEEETEEADEASPEESSAEAASIDLEDGVYDAEFNTDSSMFHVNEANEGLGTLTVEDGSAVIHISLVSKNIVNLYLGLAEDAQKDGAVLLEPTVDTVTYSDGYTEEVYGFDVPVPVLDEEFDLAILGEKGKWYDHKVSVSNPEKADASVSMNAPEAVFIEMEDGEYAIDVEMTGGSGKAAVSSPATLIVRDGRAYARIEWSSSHYDYMKIGTEKYLPVNDGGNSVFEIPITVFDEPMDVIGDTTAMSTPHEVEYTLNFHADSITPED